MATREREQRKRSAKTEDISSKTDQKDVKKIRRDVPTKEKTEKIRMSERDIFNLEDTESKKRDPASDLKSFKAFAACIRESLAAVKLLKESDDKTAKAEILENRIITSLHIAKLRKLNRTGNLSCARAKETTLEKRNRIDEYHLRLQNLFYEISHLQKEINKCLDFRSKDEDLKLVSVQEFYSCAPKELSCPDVTKSDEHEQRKARLQWELEQRKKLATELEEAKKKTHETQTDIQNRGTQMKSLLGKLNDILESTKPLQTFLNMPYDEKKEQYKTAKLLPQPLFVLYRNFTAFQTHSTSHGKVKAEILGDKEAAHSYMASLHDTQDAESDSDQEDETKHKSAHRRRLTSHREESLQSAVLKQHPLHVKVSVICEGKCLTQEKSEIVYLTFYYLTKLDIVTVRAELDQSLSSSCVAGGDLLHPDVLLQTLYPLDSGTHSPNPANTYDLSKLGLLDFGERADTLGRPFYWAQVMAGLAFVSSEAAQSLNGNVRDVLEKVQRNVINRLSLVLLLTQLEKDVTPLPPGTAELFPSEGPTSSLRSLVRSTVEDFKALPHAADIVETNLVDSQSIILQARLGCHLHRLNASIVLSADYPNAIPLFVLELETSNSERYTRLNSVHILSIEREINCCTDDLKRATDQIFLLRLQLERLAFCFDVFVSNRDRDSVKVRTLPAAHSGPGRSLPLKYDKTTGFFIHR